MTFKDKTFLVVGMSRSGISSAAMLLKNGAQVLIYDDAEITADFGQCENVSGKSAEYIFEKDIYCVVKSPGVPNENELIEYLTGKGITVIPEIELAAHVYKGTVIAVTGTNGKSTVTTLVNEIMRADGRESYLCGNIGIPFTGFCDKGGSSLACVEVSSFQLEDIDFFRPHVSVILNITEDHLNRHGNMENYISAKANILKNQKGTEFAVLNFDCPNVRELYQKCGGTVCWFSLRQAVNGAHLSGDKIYFSGEYICSKNDILLPGAHNLSNCLAAVCVAKIIGAENAAVIKTLKTFKGIKHRIQFVKEINGINFYNDSKATNSASAIVAVNSMNKNFVLILGGSEKNNEYKEFAELLKQNKLLKQCVLYGDAAEKISGALTENGIEYIIEKKFEECVFKAFRLCEAGEAVLLSPACASFDQFENYERRGDRFVEIVEGIGD